MSGALYSWLGAGAPSSLQSPQYLFSAGYCNTNLPLFLTITVNGCTSPSSYLSIYISDPAYISNPPSNQTICSGGNVSYNPIEGGCSTSIIYSHSATSCITGFSGNGYFNINDVLINTSAIPCTVTYSINDLGCYSSAYSFNVTVNPVPQVIVTSPTICAGDTASITTNGAATYTWSTGATATGVNTAIASPPTTSTYTVTGTNTYGCHNTAVSTVTVLNTLNTAVTQTADTLISSQSGATYQWYNCAINGLQPIIGATNQTYVPPANGQYAVAVSLGSCADTSACQLFYSVGVPSIKNNQSTITIYPNPNNGNFMVNYNLVGAEKAFFTIYEVSGRQVMQQTLNPENKIGVINAEDLSAGVYYYEFVINGGETKTNKLIIIK